MTIDLHLQERPVGVAPRQQVVSPGGSASFDAVRGDGCGVRAVVGVLEGRAAEFLESGEVVDAGVGDLDAVDLVGGEVDEAGALWWGAGSGVGGVVGLAVAHDRFAEDLLQAGGLDQFAHDGVPGHGGLRRGRPGGSAAPSG